MDEVRVTGIGAICSIGNNTSEIAKSLKRGRSGFKNIVPERFDVSHYFFKAKRGCTIDQKLFETVAQNDVTVLCDLSLIAINEALADAKLSLDKVDKYKVGLCVGTSVGGSYPFMKWMRNKVNGTERDYELLKYTTPNVAHQIAKKLNIRGPISVISTACASGTNAIGKAYDMIKAGHVDTLITGGVDVFTYLTFCGFNSLGAIDKNNCTPFDQNRKGLNLGDAASFVILQRSDKILNQNTSRVDISIGGYAIVNEAHHATAPHPDGIYALRAMRQALTQSGESIASLDYINAHGTGTKANDSMEMRAIEALMEDQSVFVSSTKSMIGHSLGAAGSIEFVITVLGMREGFIPPSIGIKEELSKSDSIKIVKNKAMKYDYSFALSNSFGFAGNMSSIAIKKM